MRIINAPIAPPPEYAPVALGYTLISPNRMGGGQVEPCDVKFSEKAGCCPHNITDSMEKYPNLILPYYDYLKFHFK